MPPAPSTTKRGNPISQLGSITKSRPLEIKPILVFVTQSKSVSRWAGGRVFRAGARRGRRPPRHAGPQTQRGAHARAGSAGRGEAVSAPRFSGLQPCVALERLPGACLGSLGTGSTPAAPEKRPPPASRTLPAGAAAGSPFLPPSPQGKVPKGQRSCPRSLVSLPTSLLRTRPLPGL